jgi:hypothetical protein
MGAAEAKPAQATSFSGAKRKQNGSIVHTAPAVVLSGVEARGPGRFTEIPVLRTPAFRLRSGHAVPRPG